MSNEIEFNVTEEIERFFDNSSLTTNENPKLKIIAGPPASGKTTIRKENFATGFVVIDSVEVFLNLCNGEYFDFPGPFEEVMELIGMLVAKRAIKEKRNIVTEIVGSDFELTKHLIDSMVEVGYLVDFQFVDCDLEVAIERNTNRGPDSISAVYAEKYQYKWLLNAANEVSK